MFSPTAQKRLDRWQQQLLDLSLRNHLLNLRDGQQAIRLACKDLVALENLVADGETLTLDSLENCLSPEEFAKLRSFDDAQEQLAAADRKPTTLLSALSARELGRRQLELYRKGKLDQEEGDINTLFLAFGVIKYKPLGEKVFHLAPIVLLPVRLERASVKNFSIMQLDEETRLNTTLLEYLKRDFKVEFPELEPLPQDEHGTDLRKILDIVSQKLSALPDFSLEEQLYLGRFSFAKYLMWNDLANRAEELAKQPLVNHLIEGTRGVYDDGISVFPPEEVDSNTNWQELYCPLAADSSQLTAVLYAAAGKSFVLHGPPGTGKSQSIANLICHNLVHGKKILFVSEKKAALDVVYRRLAKLGLQPFCLELHSNHAGKTELLAQLRSTLELGDSPEPDRWQTLIPQLQQRRKDLDAYIQALHTPALNGITPFQCAAEALRDDPAPAIRWQPPENLLAQTKEDLQHLTDTLRTALDGFSAVNPELCRQLRIFACPLDWNGLDTAKTADALAAAIPLAKTFAEADATWRTALALPDELPEATPAQRRDALKCLAEKLAPFRALPAAFREEVPTEKMTEWTELLAAAKEFRQLADALPQYRWQELAAIPVDDFQKRLQENAGKFFLARIFANRSLGKEAAAFCQAGTPRRSADDLAKEVPMLARAQELLKTNASRFKEFGTALNQPGWLEATPDWTKLEKQLETVRNIAQALEMLGARSASRLALQEGDAPPEAARAYKAAYVDCRKALAVLQAAAAMAERPARKIPAGELPEALRSALDAISSLRPYRIWRQSRTDAEAIGLTPFLDAMEEDALHPTKLLDAVKHRLLDAMMTQTLATKPLLADFIGTRQEHRIEEFQKLDAEYQSLAAKLAIAKLTHKLPKALKSEKPLEGTAIAFLRRECEKKSRIRPVRTILQNIAPLLPTLKPCFLMSPLSVAQYLPPESQFDLVVFDEASQIPVADAVGAIARGKQFICVGDRMQMPPTAFFQKTAADEDLEDDEDVAELESILDECLAVGVESSYLNWHYRSRHESLIAFSNAHYYENRLNTFPAAKDSPALGVHFEFQENAVFDRRNRCNPMEADAIVKYVGKMLADPAQRRKSIGVVTFNISQCTLIEDRFEQFRAAHPELEEAFDDSLPEPFFVKNLENVQGDERDVILFSVGYAPDADGKLLMNFGPLNRAGGERRLNVAITRAKERVVVFSSIHAAQVDLNRTSANGAQHLKEFLEYAEHGIGSKTAAAAVGEAGGLSQEAIAKVLADAGYQVERNVGCSRFRIDLAVKSPEKPGEYLLGILCDSERDAQGLTCRDRESTRPGVLKGLGWNLCHAWAAEWQQDPEGAKAALLLALRQAQSPAKPATPAHQAEKPSAKPVEPPSKPVEPKQEVVSLPVPQSFQRWQVPEPLAARLFQDNGRTKELIQEYATGILATEAPLKQDFLLPRIRKQWKGLKSTETNDSFIRQVLEQLPCHVTTDGEEKTIWMDAQQAENFRGYRVPATPEDRRPLEEIPYCELKAAYEEIRQDYIDAAPEVILKALPRKLGFTSVNAAMVKYLSSLPF
ncbi:MAG: DUF4011 domain-containing protein [Lentisphaeria bacterium]|nr:DUF4011 domain-containing protein [Lentisphaeria bacterium]